ncbi:MerR family transcriptional regulator [Solwaraspora sp. WMMA2080]|uniref:MerR family transcriptional regulator n=1 Tax=unclassified Solwaraspora TaxID=2627926 RepID=UPI00248B15F6|nr:MULTISPECIES: MerR family transcriptional regulator [unclassified Solwaraspora]WBB99013.1 MerR family transcriptional regulator [Solwaraspora sp. WMMA2059]WBC22434.1 MerR family transcriptional regulator [Solwaraspora sp. WMMA2080]
MWRIGELARMVGVSERTLRHYDKVGLLPPATTDQLTGYRWYGAAELTRLERIRGLQRLGLPLRRIADLLDAPDAQLRQALVETVTALRDDIAARMATVAAAEDHLAGTASVLPQVARVGARRLRVQHVRVADPTELAAVCPQPPTVLLTWLRGWPAEPGFRAAVATEGPGERLDLPARTVVRAVVPPTTGVVRAGLDLFAWLPRHHFTVAGPTTEDHLVDGDGAAVTLLEIPVVAALAGERSRSVSRV